ncbi:MAG TPA: hypothetical protein VIL65_13685 [Beijerinckiaceae bacterium]
MLGRLSAGLVLALVAPIPAWPASINCPLARAAYVAEVAPWTQQGLNETQYPPGSP